MRIIKRVRTLSPARKESSDDDSKEMGCASRSGASSGDSREFPVDRLIDYRPADNQFQIRWYGFGASDDTWGPAEHLAWNMIVRYFKQKQEILPGSLRRLQQAPKR